MSSPWLTGCSSACEHTLCVLHLYPGASGSVIGPPGDVTVAQGKAQQGGGDKSFEPIGNCVTLLPSMQSLNNGLLSQRPAKNLACALRGYGITDKA